MKMKIQTPGSAGLALNFQTLRHGMPWYAMMFGMALPWLGTCQTAVTGWSIRSRMQWLWIAGPRRFRSYPHPRSKVSYQHMAGSHKYVGVGHKYPRWYMMVYDGIWWCMMVYDGIWWYMMVYDGIWISYQHIDHLVIQQFALEAMAHWVPWLAYGRWWCPIVMQQTTRGYTV